MGWTSPWWTTPGLRRQVGVVLQENVLLNRSVRDNIALSVPGASMEAVVRAARLAGAHEFIPEPPHGYDTEIGERGAARRDAFGRVAAADCDRAGADQRSEGADL